MSFFRIALISLFLLFPLFSHAEMKYDPISDQIYTWPAKSNVNPYEYQSLFIEIMKYALNCDSQRTLTNKSLFYDPNGMECKTLRTYIEQHLKRIGTPTALRLLADLKEGCHKNKIKW